MPVELESDIAALQFSLSTLFAGGNGGILRVRTFIAQRKGMLLPAGIAKLSYNAAVKQIDSIALDGIVRSIDIVTERHVALIKLLNREEMFWTNLKEAIKEKDQKAIRQLAAAIDVILDKELRLAPTDTKAQAVLVGMTQKQMEKIAGLR